MAIFSKPKLVASTAFSRFIRDASAAEKKKVYREVLRRATERQNALLAEAALENRSKLENPAKLESAPEEPEKG